MKRCLNIYIHCKVFFFFFLSISYFVWICFLSVVMQTDINCFKVGKSNEKLLNVENKSQANIINISLNCREVWMNFFCTTPAWRVAVSICLTHALSLHYENTNTHRTKYIEFYTFLYKGEKRLGIFSW